MERIEKELFTQLGISDEEANLLVKYSEIVGKEKGQNLLGHLSIDKEARRSGSFRLVSRKISNIYFNWKTLLFDTLPAVTGALVTVGQSEIAALLIGLQALRSAAGLGEIKFDNNHSELILILHRLSLSEAGEYTWITVDKLAQESGKERTELIEVLRYLRRVGVVEFNLTDDSVRMTETIEFVESR